MGIKLKYILFASILILGFVVTCYASDNESLQNVKLYASDNMTDTPLQSDSSGRLLISDVATTPVNTVEKSDTQLSSTNSTSGLDSTYTITNGKDLIVQLFEAGAQSDATAGSAIELFVDDSCNNMSLTRISTIYVNGNSKQNSVSTTVMGNGTTCIRMRRRSLGGGSREIYGRWKGFEQ